MDRLIEEGVKVDCILTDVPYGTTACKWDSIIPFEPMWERINKLIKPNGAIALHCSQPFTTKLINSNISKFRYELVWEKTIATNPFMANKMPLKKHENIAIFYSKLPTYNPQFTEGKPYTDNGNRKNKRNTQTEMDKKPIVNNGYRYPSTVMKFSNKNNGAVHPTQKPVDLLEYLIKTYTNENELVLDFTMGSGSTGVACMNTNRKFIGIELDEDYFNIAKDRIENSIKNK